MNLQSVRDLTTMQYPKGERALDKFLPTYPTSTWPLQHAASTRAPNGNSVAPSHNVAGVEVGKTAEMDIVVIYLASMFAKGNCLWYRESKYMKEQLLSCFSRSEWLRLMLLVVY